MLLANAIDQCPASARGLRELLDSAKASVVRANKAIQKLRQALDDSSDNPRFIETLPRKGYRFIAPVDGKSRR